MAVQVSPVKLIFRLKVWVFIAPLLIGLAFGWLAMGEGRAIRLLDAGSARTEGEIFSLRIGSGENQSVRHRNYTYFASYRFGVAGTEYEADTGVSEAFYEAHSVGDKVSVTYALADPAVSEVEAGSFETGFGWTAVISVIFLAFAALLLRWRLTVLRSALRAASQDAREVVVESIERGGLTVAGKAHRTLTWKGRKGVTKSSRPRPDDELTQWPQGSLIRVFADPKSQREWFEGDLT